MKIYNTVQNSNCIPTVSMVFSLVSKNVYYFLLSQLPSTLSAVSVDHSILASYSLYTMVIVVNFYISYVVVVNVYQVHIL